MKKAKFAFIDYFEDRWTVSEMCSALSVTRGGYYAWKSRGVSKHDERDIELTKSIVDIYQQSRGVYGAPKIWVVLSRQGIHTSRKRVARLMAENDLRGSTRGNAKRACREKRVTQRDSAPDLVKRNFSATGPNEVWVADITYVKTHQGWLYLALVMDVWSRKIVGWSMNSRMKAKLADDALSMAIARRKPKPGCIHHSDHGSQYVSLLLGKTMKAAGIEPSMGAISSPWDNAAAESLMGIIKSECVHARTFSSRDEAALEIFEYIECFYNKIRIHSALDWVSPDEFEAMHIGDDRSEAA